MLLPSNQHLSYCSNIHPGETWRETFWALRENIPYIKSKLSPNKSFGIGLRLSNEASIELLSGSAMSEFKSWLKETDAYVFTINGFPYGGFHHTTVKDDVHTPDWTTKERVDYTKRLALILSQLMITNEGSISTSPLSYKYWYDEDQFDEVYHKTTANILQVADYLQELEVKIGKQINIAIEPEPDGLIENGVEMMDWYRQYLWPAALQQGKSKETINQYITVCYDVCHFAVGYENHAYSVAQFRKEGIKIGKVQISAALKLILSIEEKDREFQRALLWPFADSTYLHQVIQKNQDDTLTRYPDLPVALPHLHYPEGKEWRIHFHVPVFKEIYHEIHSTQQDILEVLKLNAENPVSPHLEVETYTWEVLPKEDRLDMKESICRELLWVMETIGINSKSKSKS